MIKKRLLQWLAVVLLALLCCAPAYAAENEPSYVTTVFNRNNGLYTDESNDVLQTEDGYLWVCSYGGLLRYNGSHFRNFSTEGAIGTSSTRVLMQDSAGRMWVGSGDSGVFVYENNTFTQIPCTEKYGFLSIRDFAESADGTVYAASSSGLGIIRDGVMTPCDDPLIKGETVLSLALDRYGRLWAGMTAGKCAVLQNDRVVAILTSEAFFDDGSEPSCIAADSNNDLYIGTTGGMAAKLTLTGEALDASNFSVQTFRTGGVVSHNRIRVTPQDDVLISGQTGLLWIAADGTRREFEADDRADAVSSAMMDSEGDIWLTSTSVGLVRYSRGYFFSPNRTAELEGKDINAVTAAGGLYYTGSDRGLRAFDAGWNPVDNGITGLLGSTRIQTLMTDSRDRLWCGTYSDKGVVRYDPSDGSVVRFNFASGLKSINIRTIYEMTDGTVAVGTQDGLALIRGDAVTAFYDKKDGFDTHSILCMAEAYDGTLLVGTAGSGIYAVKDGVLTRYSFEQGLADGVVLRILSEEGNRSGFVSAGSHLYYWGDDTFRQLDNLEIGVGSIFDLYERDGKLWLLQDSGIYAVDKELLLSGKTAHATHYGVNHGLSGSLSVNTWHYMMPDGELCLATRSGISVFDFRELEAEVPNLAVNNINVDGTVYERPESLVLPSSAWRMTVDFSALSLSGTADLSMAYRLIGFAANETVLNGSTGSTVSYTNLPGGEYTFRLRVYNPNNPTIQRTLYVSIIKEKTLSEQPLFWIACATLLVLIAAAAVRLYIDGKTKRIRRRQQVYRGIVEQSLRTIANTIDAKDSYTNGHSVRVAWYSQEIARRMGCSDDEREKIYYIALMHDIGKIGIPDSILNKDGDLTPQERAVIQTHPAKGGDILRNFTALEGISDGARYHHERYDGKGYGTGLAGEEIPLVARIICVADSYDAMASDRCYRKALSQETILSELENGKGTQFDPQIAAIMIDMIRDGTAPIRSSDTKDPVAGKNK